MTNKVWTFKDLMDSEIENPEWLIPGILAKGSTTMLFGKPETAKTWISMMLSLSCSSGNDFFNKQCPPKKVLYIDCEMGTQLFIPRLKQIARGMDITSNENFKTIFDDNSSLIMDKSDSFEQILELKPDIIIIDSLQRVLQGDTNDATNISKVFSNLKKFTMKGGSVFLIHHMTKGSSEANLEALRGSGDLGAFPRIVLSIKKLKDTYLMQHVKLSILPPEYREQWNFSIIGDKDKVNFILDPTKITISETDNCIDKIMDWFDQNNYTEFSTGKDSKFDLEIGFTQNTRSDSLIKLTKMKKIIKMKRGEYKVIL